MTALEERINPDGEPEAELRLESRPAPPAVAPRPAPVGEDVPRAIGGQTTDEKASLAGALIASLALVWVINTGLLAWTGTLGFIVCWWLAFVALYAAVSGLSNPRPLVIERVVTVIVTSGASIVGLALISTVLHVFIKGWPALHHMNFYSHGMAGVRPTAPLNQGGVVHAIVGSAIEIAIAVTISLPLGLGTAVYLTEVGGRLARVVRTVVEAMTALPDILAGLFIYSLLIISFHWERTGLTASLALVVTIIPIIARSAEVALRVVPGGLREASLALGASQWQTVRRVVLPSAKSGLATAFILGVARIAGETAPLLIVSDATTYFNRDPLHGQMNSLPMFIFFAVRSGQPNNISRGYGAAALLLGLVLTS
jgi:phosphate transport system permease protein